MNCYQNKFLKSSSFKVYVIDSVEVMHLAHKLRIEIQYNTIQYNLFQQYKATGPTYISNSEEHTT